ncbi:hypothetical protein ACH5RR_002745 [Cinchona calisaya]|uniref:Uncharacterized protein n=1 Tax=Cinchona calisaya TaxID=153742 RepID=A0ABD3ASU9_9GENT
MLQMVGSGRGLGLQCGQSDVSSIISEVPNYLFGLDNSNDADANADAALLRESQSKLRSASNHIASNNSLFTFISLPKNPHFITWADGSKVPTHHSASSNTNPEISNIESSPPPLITYQRCPRVPNPTLQVIEISCESSPSPSASPTRDLFERNDDLPIVLREDTANPSASNEVTSQTCKQTWKAAIDVDLSLAANEAINVMQNVAAMTLSNSRNSDPKDAK